MNNSSYLVIANWKMYFSYRTTLSWATTYCKEIAQITNDNNTSFVICTSYDALASIAPITTEYKLFLGAQNCSTHKEGAYTGQVSATSLQEIGCTYALVGHSEARLYEQSKNHDILLKAKQLLMHNITPILCIGETKQEYEEGKSIEIIRAQLEPLLPLFQNTQTTMHIAYEPVWAIGTNTIPSEKHLAKIFNAIYQMCKDATVTSPIFVYGGSIDENNIHTVITIPHIQGILVGRASTDFQKIKTIVSLVGKRSLRI